MNATFDCVRDAHAKISPMIRTRGARDTSLGTEKDIFVPVATGFSLEALKTAGEALVALPPLRVFFTAVLLARARERTLAALAIFVLTVLALSFVLGWNFTWESAAFSAKAPQTPSSI